MTMYKTKIKFEDGNYMSITSKLDIGCLKSGFKYLGVHNILGAKIFNSSEYYIDMVDIENDVVVYLAKKAPPPTPISPTPIPVCKGKKVNNCGEIQGNDGSCLDPPGGFMRTDSGYVQCGTGSGWGGDICNEAYGFTCSISPPPPTPPPSPMPPTPTPPPSPMPPTPPPTPISPTPIPVCKGKKVNNCGEIQGNDGSCLDPPGGFMRTDSGYVQCGTGSGWGGDICNEAYGFTCSDSSNYNYM